MGLLPLWFLALGCAAMVPVPAWPDSGCESTHRVTLGHTLVAGDRAVLEPGLALGVLSPMETGCWPAIVLVPPGIQDGLSILDTELSAQLASAGIVVVAYDPSGRGASSGEENYGGLQHQGDLAAVLRWTANLDAVDPNRVTVLSRSFGIAAAAGALAGDASLSVQNLVDLEGPASLPDDLQYVADHAQETLYQAATGEDWWLERSASESLGAYPGHYLRIQALSDHATGTWVGHALRLMQVAQGGSAATASLNGIQSESWDYESVQAEALAGRVKVDDPRAVTLVLEAVNRSVE